VKAKIIQLILSNEKSIMGLILLAVPLAMALVPQLIAPYDPWKTVDRPFLPPSSKHLLGTNDIGQDIFSELVYGARISLLVGFAAAASAVAIGTVIGLIAGYYGGIAEEVLSSITDVMFLIPVLPFMILMAAFLGQGYQNIILAIAAFSWPGVARMVKAQVKSFKNVPFIEAARAIGAGDLRIMFKHILPQLYPLITASTILRIGGAIIAESSLSFLGMGDPTQKSWGGIIYWAMNTGAITSGMWWWIVAPGIMITITVLGLSLIGYAVEEYVNPRLRKR